MPTGKRTWRAVSHEHAAEQHNDLFLGDEDEEILSIHEVQVVRVSLLDMLTELRDLTRAIYGPEATVELVEADDPSRGYSKCMIFRDAIDCDPAEEFNGEGLIDVIERAVERLRTRRAQ